MAFGLPGHGDVGRPARAGGPELQYSDGTGWNHLGSVDGRVGFDPILNLDLNFDLGSNALQQNATQPLSMFPSIGSDSCSGLGLQLGLELDGIDLLGSTNPLDDLSFFGDEVDDYGLVGGAVGRGDAGDPLGIMVDR